MKFWADHYFAIGAAHLSSGKPCQDHALSGFSPNLACAVISDGCSSGGHTDVGARILTLSTMQAMRDSRTLSIEAVAHLQRRILQGTQGLLGLRKGDLQATCAYICLSPEEGVAIHVQGDGVVALKDRSGRLTAHHYEWANNAPYYPSYTALGEEGLFLAYHGARYALANVGTVDALTGTISPNDFYAVCAEYAKTGDFDKVPRDHGNLMTMVGQRARILSVDTFDSAGGRSNESFTGEEGVRGRMVRLDPSQLADVSLIGVFSDGASQVENMTWQEATTEFVAMKNVAGEFAKRRMIRAIKTMRERGRGPLDDVSGAMICLEES